MWYPFWYGIGLVAGAVETLHPRSGARDEVEQACRELGVDLKGPFPTRSAAWGALKHEQEALEKRTAAPPPPHASSPPPAEPTTAPPTRSAPVTRAKAKAPARTAPSKRGVKSSTKKKRAR